ncbi:outer membrane beta-barrel protein [Aquabacterium sp. OR-4]|uniref:outer membrane beta-barrel protein n=1 Tax=Aquabacterium sp. OR-4 TaxID=2978127 RepID=UPI0021B377C1|nr:outer membrane beta-barrel protein [Aquabacterium sp. OR-4]MDT7834111.1 OmpA family protein [Aquabacterium sp. OR-4]
MTFTSTLTLRNLGLASLAGFTCLAAVPAQAQVREAPYGYVGLGLGRSQGDFGTEAQVAAGVGAGGSVTGFARDSNDTGYKIFGGYQFNRNVAVEGGYFDLGKLGYDATTTPAGTVGARFKLNGLSLDLVGTLPLTTNFALLGRVGMASGRARARYDTTGAVTLNDVSKRGTNAKVGLGVQYAMGSNMLVRAEVERYRMNDAVGSHVNTNLVSVGLVFPFGSAPAPAPRAQAPAPYVVPPVAAAPAPAPIIVVQAAPVLPAPTLAPVAPPRRRVTFSAESQFGFDRSEVNDVGRVALDTFARELEGTQFDMVEVEGHTDRLGSNDYNQTLSRQRADAVKNYLVTRGHVDPMKVTASGKGESSPVTKPQDCVGSKATAQLVTCLAPDRRVDVDVVGTR